jgi:hypothetical protein
MLPGKKFGVEHALSMYADGFVVMPASAIYDKMVVDRYKSIIRKCHVYIIGTVPIIDHANIRMEGNNLITVNKIAGNHFELEWTVRPGAKLVNTKRGWFVESDGLYWAPSDEEIARRLNDQLNVMPFEVLYIGQAYGKEGSRNALDRLLNHATFQKISLTGIAADRRLTLLMIEIESDNRLITMINPWAKNKAGGEKRITAGLDKLFGTSEAERVTLFEASLIRYFQPQFNKEFKDSFPSTNLKILSDCYDKDFSAIASEICIDELPFKLCSSVVQPAQYHSAGFNLHDDAARQVFFFR